MGLGAVEQGVALVEEAWAAQEPTEWVGGSRMAGCRSRALPHEKAAKAPARNPAQRRWAGTAGGPSTPSAADGPGAKPLIARGRQGRPAAPSAGPAKPTPTRNSSWPASAARSPGSRSRLSLHTSLQAEGAGSGLGQPRKGLLQCSGGLKGLLNCRQSGSPGRGGAESERGL
nr:translation initiation factor IF-2-like [Gorilla gorilla gorilla]